jgi:hypothetical protein
MATNQKDTGCALDALSSPIALDALSGNDEREEAMRLQSVAIPFGLITDRYKRRQQTK